MEKELKISELASIWNTSVPTAWNRVRKEGLKTFKKKNENNKEINYVMISDEIINKYFNNVNNNVINNVNNGYYEDLLTVENVNNNVNNPQIQTNKAFTKEDLTDIINTITTVNNDYNNRLETLTNRLITAESKQLLLEDKAGREGLYLKEINDLKKENNRNKLYNKLLLTVITFLLLLLTGYITYNVASNPKSESEQVQAVQEPVQQPQPPVKTGKRK